MTDYITIDPRTHSTEVVSAPDWPTACRQSSLTDACVVYVEPSNKVTAHFLNLNGMPFGITAADAERALAWVAQHQDACRAADERVSESEA